MAVYVDRLWRSGDRVWAHIFADTTAELHDFVTKTLGVKRERFRGHLNSHFPHYAINEYQYQRAINLGAAVATRKQIITVYARFGDPAALRTLRTKYGVALPREEHAQGVRRPEGADPDPFAEPEPEPAPQPVTTKKFSTRRIATKSSGRLKAAFGRGEAS